ncbi:vacuolar amino acid transporter [Suhomyces tanzawaensis NRRL Y-17324]|uniref:Vacuolar amino acid transporter n=1 Tax=Suhomyces tanzawaensis NRRL Y-17324 TaxID=984487 RepID=A0A1E4SR17_9ASCO|nr:vacuolar amino acid transporter [Suhomyces tanzawaensis NRRL Y-17324]ODV81949.1 vacuolar amino acid transporter [Suhomyces tanzawaensis NRRL Y-17324]
MGTATIKSGSINLLNTIIGAGILAMPFGLKSNGLLLGCLLIVWSSLTSSFGLYLQNKVAKYTQQQGAISYFSLAQITYPHLSVVFDSAISIKCFGVGVSYLVVIGDLMPKIMESLHVAEESLLMHRNFWITLFMAVIVVPLSYLKKLDSLKYTSVVALFSVVYLICLVIEHYAVNDIPIENKTITWFGPVSLKSTLSSFPIFVFAYTCHQNMFAIINELKPLDKHGSTTRQSNLIIRNAITTAAASYLIVGIIGYLSFGDSVNGNIITMYPRDSILSLIGRLCIVIMVSLSFPLQCHPCRGSINHVLHFLTVGITSSKTRSTHQAQGYTSLQSDIESLNSITSESIQDESFISTTPVEGAQDTDGHSPIIVPLTTKRFYVITTIIVTLSYLVAITVTSLEHVLAFVGSTGSTSISFILPGLFGYLLIKPINGATELNRLELCCKYGGLALAIWGVIVMIVCLGATIFLGATH